MIFETSGWRTTSLWSNSIILISFKFFKISLDLINPEWDLFINPDPQTNKYAQPETEYHVPLPEDDPGFQILENSNVNTEFGLRFKKYYESGDYAFFAAWGKVDYRREWPIIFRKLFKLSEPVISFPKIDVLKNQF